MHHIFGGETCELVRQAYGDAYLAAHFEVPGEMFTLAMEVSRGRGSGRDARIHPWGWASWSCPHSC